jgi:hypothetical protein
VVPVDVAFANNSTAPVPSPSRHSLARWAPPYSTMPGQLHRLSHFASLGNKADVDEAALFEYWKDIDHTNVIIATSRASRMARPL